jgi:iron complex transport system substrate-binding protein
VARGGARPQFDERLRALAPDFIVTQAQCEVCAVSERELHSALAQWMGATGPAIVSLTATALQVQL